MTVIGPVAPALAGNRGPGGEMAAAEPVESRAKAQARATAQAFEAVFIGQLTKSMMESAEGEGSFSGGHGETMFRGVLAEKLGTEAAKAGGLGLAPAVMQEIIKLQQGNKP